MKQPKLTVQNATGWATRDLRRVMRAAMKHVGVEQAKTLIVEYGRGERYSFGRGELGRRWTTAEGSIRVDEGRRVWLYMPRRTSPFGATELVAAGFASTLVHELHHNRGLHHREMNWRGGYDCPGAVGLRIAWTEKPKPTASEAREATVAKREASARAHLARLEQEIARKQKLRAKWQARVRYYDRKRAAAPRPKP